MSSSWEHRFDFPRLRARIAARKRHETRPSPSRGSGRKVLPRHKRVLLHDENEKLATAEDLVKTLKTQTEVFWALKKFAADASLQEIKSGRSTESPHAVASKTAFDKVAIGSDTVVSPLLSNAASQTPVIAAGLRNAAIAMVEQRHKAVNRLVRRNCELTCVLKLRQAFENSIFEKVQEKLLKSNTRAIVCKQAGRDEKKPKSAPQIAHTMDDFWDSLDNRAHVQTAPTPSATRKGVTMAAHLPITTSKIYDLLVAHLHSNNRSKTKYQHAPTYCNVIPLSLDVPNIFELRAVFKDLDPRLPQVGIDDCSSSSLRPPFDGGDTVLSALHDASASMRGIGVPNTSVSSSPVPHRHSLYLSHHDAVNFDARRQQDVLSNMVENGGYVRKVRDYCKRGCLPGQRRRLWQLMLQCGGPQGQMDSLAAIAKSGHSAQMISPPSLIDSGLGEHNGTDDFGLPLELVTPGGSIRGAADSFVGISKDQLPTVGSTPQPQMKSREAYPHLLSPTASSTRSSPDSPDSDADDEPDAAENSLFAQVEGRYTLGSNAASSRRQRFYQLLLLWQNVELCTDSWLEADLLDTMNTDAFFVFDNELRSVLYAISRDVSIQQQIAATIHTQIFFDVSQDDLMRASSSDVSGARLTLGADSRPSTGSRLSSNTVPVSVPPCGFVPFQGQAALCAPLFYFCEDRVVVFEMFRQMLCRYWCRLQSVSSTERGSLLWLCALFESLMRVHLPEVCEHMVTQLGAEPLKYALPWIRLAFADYLMLEEVLVVWDRILVRATIAENFVQF